MRWPRAPWQDGRGSKLVSGQQIAHKSPCTRSLPASKLGIFSDAEPPFSLVFLSLDFNIMATPKNSQSGRFPNLLRKSPGISGGKSGANLSKLIRQQLQIRADSTVVNLSVDLSYGRNLMADFNELECTEMGNLRPVAVENPIDRRN